MSGKLYIEAKPVFGSGFYHAYLVYEDANGNEFVIRGGAQKELAHPLGHIKTEAGIPIEQSDDYRDPLQAAKYDRNEINLGGRDASSVFAQMQNTAEIIPAEDIFYNPIGVEDSLGWGLVWGNYDQAHNSNSTIAAIMQSAGIDPLANLPKGLNAAQLPGIFRPLPYAIDNDASYTQPLGIPNPFADNPFQSSNLDQMPPLETPDINSRWSSLEPPDINASGPFRANSGLAAAPQVPEMDAGSFFDTGFLNLLGD